MVLVLVLVVVVVVGPPLVYGCVLHDFFSWRTILEDFFFGFFFAFFFGFVFGFVFL